MKTIINLCILGLIVLGSVPAAGQRSVRSMVSQLKDSESYEGISIPGWLIRMGAKIAARHNDELRESGILNVAGKIRHLRIAKAKIHDTKLCENVYSRFLRSISQDGFEEYVSLRDEDQHLNLFVCQKGDQIRNILIAANDGGEVSLIHLKTRPHPNDLASISFGKLVKNDSATNQNTSKIKQ